MIPSLVPTPSTSQVVGFDPDKDIAVLRLDMPADKMKELRPVQLGESEGLLVGQKVSRNCCGAAGKLRGS